MTTAQKLLDRMEQGRVYRRGELAEFTGAVDRDLKKLVEAGEVRRLAGGLYCRPKRNALGAEPPENQELVRAFLKTDDFLLTSYNNFTDLGFGLTQVYGNYLVYNHRRSGDFRLGGKRFKFLVVPAYPEALSKEYLLVDLLNNLRKLPDDVAAALKNLKPRLDEFDRDKVSECLARYGNPAAKRALRDSRA